VIEVVAVMTTALALIVLIGQAMERILIPRPTFWTSPYRPLFSYVVVPWAVGRSALPPGASGAAFIGGGWCGTIRLTTGL
jgi:hypothetical protein